MSNVAFLVINSGFGNVGQPPPNAVIYADMVVKSPDGTVVASQPSGCVAQLTATDTNATIAAKLTASAQETMNDPNLKVVFL